MKKYIFAAVLSLSILASPAFAQASSLTSSQISAIMSLLQSFGVDQSVIDNVQVALGGTSTGGGTQPWCHTFNTDLTVGSSGDEVSALNQALSSSGIDITGDSANFDENTAADIVQFQAEHGIRQTGYVGPLTRAKLSALYGCPPSTTPPPSPATCTPRPACLDATPRCLLPEPVSGWCPATVCTPRPACLDAIPRCLLPEPVSGWCPAIPPSSDNNPPSITVLSPNGNEQWQKETVQKIQWSAPSSVSAVSISLEQWYACLNAVPRCEIAIRPYTLAASTQNDGMFEWTVGKDASGLDIPAGQYTLTVSGGTSSDTSDAPFSIVVGTATSTPLTLSAITPASGPVGTSVRLDGCGSDSSSGFTLVYTGPKSGSASIPVETLGAASGCGYMTFTVSADFPAGAYTLQVKNNQTGAVSTNSEAFTVTASSTKVSSYSNPNLASALGALSGSTNSVSQNAGNFTYIWNRDLQIGSPYSDDITALQKALTREGVYGGEITGGFYNQTYTAVKAFQQKHGIDATGFVGPLTRSKLNTLY